MFPLYNNNEKSHNTKYSSYPEESILSYNNDYSYFHQNAHQSLVSPPPPPSDKASTNKELPSIKVVKNDYNQHFVDTGERPQNFIRDHEASARFLEYPKLAKLIRLKDELFQRRAHPPVHIKHDLKTFDWASLETKFDVILIDPPWKEYYERAISLNAVITEDLTPWNFDEMLRYLKIDRISEVPSFCFLWCGTSHLDEGRALLQAWGFRRCEHICWCKMNNISSKQGIHRVDMMDGLFQRTTEHCLMGVKGAVKRSVDTYFVHSNIDTDVIISEEPVDAQGKPSASTQKPVELHEIIERFCLGRKKIELFGLDRNIRPGWLTIGSEISVSYYNPQKYLSWFNDDNSQDGQCGRYIGTNAKIEQLRPKSPVRNIVQSNMQQM